MDIIIKLFLTFLRIGAFGFGGGFAAIPLIQSEVVSHYGWITSQEFANIMAIASMTPGPIAINSATYVGFKIYGIIGGLVASFGVVFVSFILIGIIAGIMTKFTNNKYVNSVLEVLRPVIVVLILVAAINTGKTAFVDFREVTIFAAAIILLLKTKFHPIALIVGFGIMGIFIY